MLASSLARMPPRPSSSMTTRRPLYRLPHEPMRFLTWKPTVAFVMPRRSAICLFDIPCDKRPATIEAVAPRGSFIGGTMGPS